MTETEFEAASAEAAARAQKFEQLMDAELADIQQRINNAAVAAQESES